MHWYKPSSLSYKKTELGQNLQKLQNELTVMI